MAKGNKHNQRNRPNPIVHQLVNLLNRTSQVSGSTLDKAGTKDASPILHSIMQMGYRYAPVNELGFPNQMSDTDAITAAIHGARKGFTLGQNFGNVLEKAQPKMAAGTASGNILKQLVKERVNSGMSKGQALSSIHDELKQENMLLKRGNVAGSQGSTLNPNELAASVSSPGGNAQPSPGDGGDFGFNPSRGMFDPVVLAQNKAQGNYYNQGMNDISQYNQNAQLMQGLVPDQLKPLYTAMVDQRTQEMANNLNLMNSQMQAAPYIQQLRNAARDFKTQARAGGSAGGGLNALLSGSGGGSGNGGGGVTGSGSNDLSGADLSDQILNQLALAKQYGTQYSQFENPVISNSQMTFLRDFIPRSNKGASMVPAVAQYLGANGY